MLPSLKSLIVAGLLALAQWPALSAPSTSSAQSGKLLIIGGGPIPASIVQTFISQSGGPASKLLIFPHASSVPAEAAASTQALLKAQGAKDIEIYACPAGEMDKPQCLKQIESAKGIFFTGGDQNKLMQAFLQTRAHTQLWGRFRQGALIAGTSAGAAVMSQIMLTGDEVRPTHASRIDPETEKAMEPFAGISKGRVLTAAGFGFVTRYIVDQHFIVRKRQNRLLNLVLERPELIGVGIDESTGILVEPDQSFTVVGEAAVMIFDAREAKTVQANDGGVLSARNVKLHLLTAGMRFGE